MKKIWVSGRDYIGSKYNYNDKRFLEFRSALMGGITNEVNNKVPLLEDTIVINANIKSMFENPNFFIRVLTTEDRTHIYGLIIMMITNGFFTKTSLTFPLTTLTNKADNKDIFKLIKESKRLLAELREKVDYVSLETVLKDSTIISHNKRILEWYVKKYGNVSKIYEVYVDKVSKNEKVLS